MRTAQYAVEIERDVRTPMSDGVTLVSNVYRPKGPASVPAVLVRAPYSQSWKTRLMSDIAGKFWASRGYAVVLQSSRGRLPSGGEFYPLAPERSDGIDTLHWLAAQPWCDGRIGMWGGSSFGYTQWAIADQREPGPKAYMIQIASSEVREMLYPGGAFALESGLYWALRSYRDMDKIPSARMIDRGVNGYPLREADNRAVEDIPFFDDWATHTQQDKYWKEIDGEDRAASIQAPVHLIGGWHDPFLPAQLKGFERIRGRAAPPVARDTRLLIGPWSHAASFELPESANRENYRRAALAPAIDWFDTHLAGTSDAARKTAPVRLFVLGINQWRDEQEWPLARAEDISLYLRSNGRANTVNGDGMLSLQVLERDEPADSFEYDPRNPVPTAGGAVLGKRAGIKDQNRVERRRDVLVYTSPVLAAPVEVTGNVCAILHVATTAPNTDFTAKLVDVHPDGRAFNVCDGILRRDFRTNSPPTSIRIELWPTSMVFKAGHQIRLEVSSSNFPRFDRNPNTGGFIPAETQPVSARQWVFHSAGMASQLCLPVIPSDISADEGRITFES
ncbi:MAG: CocE/NonD family hydrolase [Candidatus Hydrogenedentes bacterium]|nr:CocE/NonD family hydrolase [Candidatus Hydrogenedentota bacterium]